jgi:GntR family transcriptional regulator, transcriptional repressor for pyruvate dehydrogenase complex
MERTVTTRPTRESLSETLVGDIVSGRLAHESKLPAERELAAEFGLSRPIVREVLRGLQERGLVDIVPARGTFVRAPSPADGARSLELHYRRHNATARDVMDARLMLETQTARFSALRADEREVSALERELTQAVDADNVVDRARHDITFHGLLARASANPVIETMFGSIAGLAFELMLRSHADSDVAGRGLPYHRTILDAIRAHDPDRAEEAMRAHLDLAATMYGEDYDRNVEEVARHRLQRFLGPDMSLDELVDEAVGQLSGIDEVKPLSATS